MRDAATWSEAVRVIGRHKLGRCQCLACTIERDPGYRWPEAPDDVIGEVLAHFEPQICAQPGSTDEPNLTDDSADRAALIVQSALAELRRRSAGDVPQDIRWRNARARFVMLVQRARRLTGYMTGGHGGDQVQPLIDEASELAMHGNPLITDSDLALLAAAAQLLDHALAQGG